VERVKPSVVAVVSKNGKKQVLAVGNDAVMRVQLNGNGQLAGWIGYWRVGLAEREGRAIGSELAVMHLARLDVSEKDQ
jgi:hypothetical protein